MHNFYIFIFGFNWVDVILLIVFLRGFVIEKKSVIFHQIFKLFGILFSTVVTLHYYLSFAKFLHSKVLFPAQVVIVFSFFAIAISIYFIFKVITKGWLLILKVDTQSEIDKWGGTVISVLRSYFVVGLLFFSLLVLRIEGVTKSAKTSISGSLLRNTSVSLYRAGYHGVIKHLFKNEELNSVALSLVSKKKSTEE